MNRSRASFPLKRPGLREHGGFWALVLVFLAVVFREDLFSGSDLFFKAFRDINPLIYSYPLSRVQLMSWNAGLFPLWNPYNLLGSPLPAAYQPGVFSPLLWPLVFFPLEAVAVPYLLARPALAGWGLFLFLRKKGLTRGPARLGGIAFALSGYLIQYVNDQHLVIDLLLPFILLFADNLAKRAKARDFVAVSLTASLALLGGQPAAALFTLAVGFGYGLFMACFRERSPGRAALVLCSMLPAALISSIQLLPFFEMFPWMWTFHFPGMGSEHLSLPGLAALVFPGIFGPLDKAREFIPLVRLSPYLGATIAALALARALRPRTAEECFFAGVLISGLGLLAGLPGFNLLPRLPGLSLLTFIKYTQPPVFLAACALAAMSVEELERGGGELRVSGTAAAVLFPVFMLAASGKDLFGSPAYFRGALFLAAVVLLGVAAVSLLSRRFRDKRRGRVSWFLSALVIIELVSASLTNRPFMFRNLAREDWSSLKRAFSSAPLARFAASEDVLLPDQGTLIPAFEFGQADVAFIRNSVELFRTAADQEEQEFFREFMKYHSFRLPLNRAFSGPAQVLGLRFALSRVPLPESNPEAWLEKARILAASPLHYGMKRMTIREDTREALFAHPPFRAKLPLSALMESQVEAENPAPSSGLMIFLSPGIDPAVYERRGDGVWFIAAGTGGGLLPRLSYARYLDPRRVKAERRWMPAAFAAPFSKEPRKAALLLITLPGNTDENDWAGWGDLCIRVSPRPLPSMMANGIRIYENPAAFPRAFPASLLFEESDLDMISEDELPPAFFKPPASRNGNRQDRPENSFLQEDSCAITRYGLQRVELRCELSRPGLLVLTDAYYPGWRGFVNGKEARIRRVCKGLRAVPAGAGEQTVEFIYQPLSFRVGLWISLASLGSGLIAFFIGGSPGKPRCLG